MPHDAGAILRKLGYIFGARLLYLLCFGHVEKLGPTASRRRPDFLLREAPQVKSRSEFENGPRVCLEAVGCSIKSVVGTEG
jgi:hypothetical protein